MTTYSRGEVVLVPFPFTDADVFKQRPAVVISADWYNNTRPDCVLAAITSTFHSNPDPDEVTIIGAEVKHAGLIKDGIIKTGKVFTIQQSRVIKPLGHLTNSTKQKVIDSLKKVFSIP